MPDDRCPIHGRKLECPSCRAAKAGAGNKGLPASKRRIRAQKANVKKRWAKEKSDSADTR